MDKCACGAGKIFNPDRRPCMTDATKKYAARSGNTLCIPKPCGVFLLQLLQILRVLKILHLLHKQKFLGATDGARTRDNQNHNLGLYQLSYSRH